MSAQQKIGVLPSLLLPVEPRNFEEAKDNFIPEQVGALTGGLLGAGAYALGSHLAYKKALREGKSMGNHKLEWKGALAASVPVGLAGSYIGSAIGQYRMMNRRQLNNEPMIDERDIRYGKPALRIYPGGR